MEDKLLQLFTLHSSIMIERAAILGGMNESEFGSRRRGEDRTSAMAQKQVSGPNGSASLLEIHG